MRQVGERARWGGQERIGDGKCALRKCVVHYVIENKSLTIL